MFDMTSLQIAALYAAINALITFALAANAGRVRVKHQVFLGDGGNEHVLRGMRAHANNVEYVPLVLGLLILLALLQASATVLHVVGACLALGRAFHGLGLATRSGISLGRGLGMLFTLIALLTAVVVLLMKALA